MAHPHQKARDEVEWQGCGRLIQVNMHAQCTLAGVHGPLWRAIWAIIVPQTGLKTCYLS